MQLDWFPGRSVLSDKLLRDSLPADYENEVRAELGEQALPAFRHALECFQGQLRASGEPAICHTADVAIRAADLALPPSYIITALLHDSVEDTSDNPAEMVEGLADIGKKFGDTIRADVRLLTNRYNLIVRHAMKSLAARSVRLSLSEESLSRVAAEIRVLRRVQPPETQEELSHEYTRLARVMPSMDISKALEISRFNRKYNLDTEISLQLYGLFIDDMVDDFKQRNSKNGPGFYDAVLVVKFMDAIDNLRTSAATERLKLEKILQKSQMILDKSFHLHEYLYQNNLQNRLFPLAYEMLKYTMVEQMIERKQALQNLADTRFSPLSEFMVSQISSLETKYKIERPPPERLREIRAEIRSLHGVTTPSNNNA
jgi:(p)ppGpp synthase/HD superfamily hydrolase